MRPVCSVSSGSLSCRPASPCWMVVARVASVAADWAKEARKSTFWSRFGTPGQCWRVLSFIRPVLVYTIHMYDKHNQCV
jgi:hypothetical protein